jgi:hypothetical protein
MNILLRPSPLVLNLMPSLKGTDSLTGVIAYNSANKELHLDIHAGKIQFNQQVIHQLNIYAESKSKGIDYNISVVDAGQPGFRIYQSALYGTLADNKLSTTLLLREKKKKSKYVLSGSLSQVNNGLRFIFNPDSLLLNYNAWQIPADNYVQYDSGGILVRNLTFSR